MSDPTGPERLKSEEDGGVPFRIGFVKQEVFDNEFDGTSSKGEGQAKASSSATPENGDLAASRNPGGPQESSARVDLAVMKTEVIYMPRLRYPIFLELGVSDIAEKLYVIYLTHEDTGLQKLFC